MPTITDLKDQARACEQQGQIDRALTIYQHILKHLEGTPALAKVIPLYVKVGDLLSKLDRPDEAVSSYEAAAEHYAQAGSAARVGALCGRVLRLAPDRSDTYTKFARRLIELNHAGPARDLLAEYAEHADMGETVQQLSGLEGQSDEVVMPALQKLLDSFEQGDNQEQTARRVSSHLEQIPDEFDPGLSDEQPAITGVGDEDTGEPSIEDPGIQREQGGELDVDLADADGDIDESDPLTPHMFDLDHMPQRTSFVGSAPDLGEEEEKQQEKPEPATEDPPEPDPLGEFTSDVTPTAETPAYAPTDIVEPTPHETSEDDSAGDTIEFLDVSESDISEDPELQADTFVAASEESAPSESEDIRKETDSADMADSAVLEDKAEPKLEVEEDSTVEQDSQPDVVPEEPSIEETPTAPPSASEDSLGAPDVSVQRDIRRPTPKPFQPVLPEHEPPSRRPSRTPRLAYAPTNGSKTKSPILFAVIGFVIGAICGAGATYFVFGTGPATDAAEFERPTPAAETQAPAEPASEDPDAATQAEEETSDPADQETQTESQVETPPPAPIDSAPDVQLQALARPPAETPETEAGIADAADEQTMPAEADAAQPTPADSIAASGNPIVVEGLTPDNVTPAMHPDGVRAGFRVVQSLDWSDSPLVIESYRDTSITRRSQVTVNVTPPDTVVGILRLEGYMVYASGIMPEDSLRSLMSRLVEGEQEN